MSKAVIDVKRVSGHELFKWVYEHASRAGCEGGSVLACENFGHVANWFSEWLLEHYNVACPSFDDCHGLCCHSDQLNIMFTNETHLEMFHRDYVFVVKEDCPYGDDRVIEDICENDD